jgi:Kef-type K+ transport system membrane component KefB
MKKFKNSLFYLGIIGFFSVLIFVVIHYGKGLQNGREFNTPQSGGSQWQQFVDAMQTNLGHPLAILLIQIVTIILVARMFGWVFKKIGQPTVIGEIIAGIVLGPSLFGMYFPDFSATLFPPDSFGNLKILSQFGLIMFMFVVGMELDLKVLRNKAKDAVVISHASIIIPFALGLVLAYFIYETFAPANVRFSSFGLFMGIALSITAFPVLARILQERGINKTRLGSVVITCAAADDITAWCILAIVIAIVKAGTFVSALYTILAAVAYVLLMIKVVRPFLKRVGDLHAVRENLSKSVVAIFFLTLLLSAFATEVIGIHALFGAFMAGAIMPENTKFRSIFIEKVEDVALVLLLPIFFVYTGLRTEIGLLNDPYLWKVTGVIILVAVAGKFLGSALAARFVGQNWKDSLIIGALMNTRGLMELVVLNIGYDLGVLTPQIFAMMVIMALATTMMTGPALDLINFIFRKKPEPVPYEVKENRKFKVLLSFDTPQSGKALLLLANSLVKKLGKNASVTAMHLTPHQVHHFNEEDYEQESFTPVVEESKKLNQPVTTLFKTAIDIDAEIAEVANKGEYDLLLMNMSESIFEGTLLGKLLGFTTRIINPEKILNTVTGKEKLFETSPFDERTRLIMARSNTPIGIFINKDLKRVNNICVPMLDANDSYLITYVQKLIHNNGAQVTVLDISGQIKNDANIKERIRSIEQMAPNHINLLHLPTIDSQFLQLHDLLIVSMDSWTKLTEDDSPWLAYIPSTLIVTHFEESL